MNHIFHPRTTGHGFLPMLQRGWCLMYRLDSIDVRIIDELQKNARVTNQSLAEKVALSPSACLMRVKKLESCGILNHYLARVALEKVDTFMEVLFEITMERQLHNSLTRFSQSVKEHPNVLSCQRISGHYDFLVRVIVKNMGQLLAITNFLSSADLGVVKVTTLPLLEEVKPFSGLPVISLLGV